MPQRVADLVHRPRFAAPLAGADRTGEASLDGRKVRIGLWIEDGRVVRARYLATACAGLIALAETACSLLEAGLSPETLEPATLLAELSGLHPVHRDRAELVAAAARTATCRERNAS